MPHPRRYLLSAALVVAVLGCTSPSAAPGGQPAEPAQEVHVVATTSILGDVVRSVVGDAGRVDVLMPAGVDPHGFAPSPRDAALLREADLVVANGLGLEEQLHDVLAAAEADGADVLWLAELLDPLPVGGDPDDDHGDDGHGDDGHGDDDHGDGEHADDEGTDDDHADDEHDHGPLDPHVWFDPLRMAEGARLLATHLAAAEGEGGLSDEEWAARGDAYADELHALDAELADILAAVPSEQRVLVTNHDNLRYLADRYGFEVVGAVIPGGSTQAEASTRRIAELAHVLEETGVPAVFAETLGSTRLVEALAQEVGRDVEVVTLYTDALGEPGSGADTYAGLLRTDARRIAEALG